MKHALSILLKQHPVMVYFALAYAISWAIEIPLAALAQGWLHIPVPPALHYVASFGPMLPALIVTAVTDGRQGIRLLARARLAATAAPLDCSRGIVCQAQHLGEQAE